MENTTVKALSVEKLRWVCDPRQFSFQSTEDVAPLEGIVDQLRAIKAIEFGLNINSPGYNIYVAGLTGTGKSSIIKAFLEKVTTGKAIPEDWCYVNNFKDMDKPLALKLPPGKANLFKSDMNECIDHMRMEIPKAFESADYEGKKKRVLEEEQEKQRKLYVQLENEALEKGFTLKSSNYGLLIFPLIEGKIIDDDIYATLDKGLKEKIEKERNELSVKVNEFLQDIKNVEKETRAKVKELDETIGLLTVERGFGDIEEKYKDFPDIMTYLTNAKRHILSNLGKIRRKDDHSAGKGNIPEKDEDVFHNYQINVFVDNSETKSPPVIIESNPTYYNMFGRIEKRSSFGTWVTDFTLIKAGAVSRANGGYLVINAYDTLVNPGVWEALKRTIKNKEVRIEDLAEQFGYISSAGLKPEPIPTHVKIIIIGNAYIYQVLYSNDEDFRKLFKVKADFDYLMDNTSAHRDDYASFISAMCRKENLKHFDPAGVAAVVEYGARVVDDQEKLSSRFSDIADIIREGSFWAAKEDLPFVNAVSVEKAIEEKIYRSSLISQRIQELIEKNILLIDITGAVVGQVNGLAVYDFGDYAFGKPSRITATTFMGRAGVVNIEREAKLSGKTHDKGVLILSSYLGAKYAQDKPLTLSANLCFEQSYEGVDGDSASSTELYALLSSLSNFPLKQGIAVTGSVNQKGEIQPIGGVNQKIEGFFELCKAKGFTKDQGVIIPESNVKNLMLKKDIIQAANDGLFHIYPIKTIDEGIEILTGQPAGIKDENGNYPAASVNYLVNEKLKSLAEGIKDFGKENNKERSESHEVSNCNQCNQ